MFLAVLLCLVVHAASVGGIWPGLIQSAHGTFVWSAYTDSFSASHEYPRSDDCSIGMMVNLSIRSIVKAGMLVEHGRGARLGSIPMAATASAYVSMGGLMSAPCFSCWSVTAVVSKYLELLDYQLS